jgi:hypothetical protein
MPITVTANPDPLNGPPSVLVEVSSGGANLTSVFVRRNGVPLVEQPPTGSPSAGVFDYQSEYGVPVTYSVQWAAGGDVIHESAVTTLDSPNGWLVHPRTPAFSFPLSAKYPQAGVVTVGERTNAARSTLHETIGNPLGIVVTVGSRGSDERTLTVGTVSKEERDNLDACLRDETPLLVRFPASWGVDFAEGFYRFGDITKTQLVEIAGDWVNRWSFPIKQVRPPRIIVQTLWTLQDVIDTYATLQDVINVYPTLYDEILNRPGG